MNSIQLLISCIESYAMFIPICPALYKYSKMSPVLKMATWYLIVVTIEQVFITVLYYQKQNNLFACHVGNVLEAITLLLAFRELFKRFDERKTTYVYRLFFIWMIVLFTIFGIVNACLWEPLEVYPSNTRIVLSLLVLFFCGLYFHKLSYEPHPKAWSEIPNYKASKTALFWIITGFAIFYGFSSFRSLFLNQLIKDVSKESMWLFETFHNSLIIIFYAFLCIGFIKAKRITGKEFSKENKYKI